MTVWQTTVDFSAGLDEDEVWRLMDAWADHGACVSPRLDMKGASVTMDVTADDPEHALSETLGIVRRDLPDATVDGFEVRDWDTAVKELGRPLFPPLVGYAEIARMAGVTRQRAHAFPRIDSFPKPVIETAQGPLYLESEMRKWVAKRNTKPGNPHRK